MSEETGLSLSRIRAVGRQALAQGALCPIGTQTLEIEERGIPFAVRVLSGLQHKVAADRAQRDRLQAGEQANPFLPYEPALHVADVGDSHVCILNKYNVVDDHLLLITRGFEAQSQGLTPSDCQALASCNRRLEGFWFYNSAPEAGASQGHKHIQFIPWETAGVARGLPVAPLIEPHLSAGRVRQADYPCRNAVVGLSPGVSLSPEEEGELLHRAYSQAMDALDLWVEGGGTRPHNVVLTPEWLLVVPRTRCVWEGFGVNALGFAGTLLVREPGQLPHLRELGIGRLLAAVACSG